MKQSDFMFVQNLGLWIILVLGLVFLMASCAIALWTSGTDSIFISIVCLLPLILTIRSVYNDRYMHNYDQRKHLWQHVEMVEMKKTRE